MEIKIKYILMIFAIVLLSSCDKPLHYSIPENILLPVEKNGNWGYINQYGKLIVEYKFDKAEQFDKDFAIVSKNNKKYLIDKSGNLVFNQGFEYLKFNGTDYSADYQYVVRPKEKKIYNIGYDAYLYWKDNVYVVTNKGTGIIKNCLSFAPIKPYTTTRYGLSDVDGNMLLDVQYYYINPVYSEIYNEFKFPFILDHLTPDIALVYCKNSYNFYKLQIKNLLQQQVLLVFAKTVMDLKFIMS